MASTLNPTRADPRFDGGAAPTAGKDLFTDVEEALARLVHTSYPPKAAPRGAASARKQRSPGKRRTRARVAIAVCLGASAILAWRSYGGPAPEQAAAPAAIEASAPPPAQAASPAGSQAASITQPATTAANEPGAAPLEHQQIETTDLAALRQTVAQLAAGQEQLTREVAKLQAERPQAVKPPAEKPQAVKPLAEKPDKHVLPRASAHAPPVAASARKPTPKTPRLAQAAPQVSTVGHLSPPPQPAPQIPSETQWSDAAPLRPPMPVPQP